MAVWICSYICSLTFFVLAAEDSGAIQGDQVLYCTEDPILAVMTRVTATM